MQRKTRMRITSGAVMLWLCVFNFGCVRHTVTEKNQNAQAVQWDYQRIHSYMANVPGIRGMERWDEAGVQGACIETEHYQVYTTLLDPLMLRQVPSFVESAYQAYESQVPDVIECTAKFKVYLFNDRQGWEAFTRQLTGPDAEVYLKIQRGAYAKDGVIVAYNIGRKQTSAVMGHEGWHQFNQHYFKYRLPSWLDEGVATLFETCQYKQGVFEFRPQDNLMRLGTLRKVIQERRMIPAARLITLNPAQVLEGYNGDGDAAMAFYAQNYAMVRFLREYGYGRRLIKYHNLLLGGLRGNWQIEPVLAEMSANRNVPLTVAWNSRVSPQLFAMYIDNDMETIENQYRQFCNEIVYHVRLREEIQQGK
jgi:hypothetical protein